jgi:hypothetical protein
VSPIAAMGDLEIFIVILGDTPTSAKTFLIEGPGSMSMGK